MMARIPPLCVIHPAFKEKYPWMQPGAPVVFTDPDGIEHHVVIQALVYVHPDQIFSTPTVIIRYRPLFERTYRSDEWEVPAASLKKDSLAEFLSIISLERDDAGCILTKLSEQDLNGLDSIIRFARDERTAGALDRIVVIAESILKRYRVKASTEIKDAST